MVHGAGIGDILGTDWNFLHLQMGKKVAIWAEGEEGGRQGKCSCFALLLLTVQSFILGQECFSIHFTLIPTSMKKVFPKEVLKYLYFQNVIICIYLATFTEIPDL